jgi:hypothetical protein
MKVTLPLNNQHSVACIFSQFAKYLMSDLFIWSRSLVFTFLTCADCSLGPELHTSAVTPDYRSESCRREAKK